MVSNYKVTYKDNTHITYILRNLIFFESNDFFFYSLALVKSSAKVLPLMPVDNDASDPVDGITKNPHHYDIEHEAKLVQFKPWDKQAKQIDRCALVLMPLLFLLVSVLYFASYLSSG